jgi:hypothetical protein
MVLKSNARKLIIKKYRVLKNVHIKKIDNNRVAENINSKPKTPQKNCLMHVSHKSNINCPPWVRITNLNFGNS